MSLYCLRSFLARTALAIAVSLYSIVLHAESVSFGGRTADLVVPSTYDSLNPASLIVLLHGYGQTSTSVDNYLKFSQLADEYGYLLLLPDGLVDDNGAGGTHQGWNATDFCCDFFPPAYDDSTFLRGLIDTVRGQYSIDDGRIFVTGHSNGGFMSYRLACDHADIISAVVSLAGATFNTLTDCAPSRPVHILQVHGTNDTAILFNGGSNGGGVSYPSAAQTINLWRHYNGCTLTQDLSRPPQDLDNAVPGAETTSIRFGDGCMEGGSSELWSVIGGSHGPAFDLDYTRAVVQFFYSNARSSQPLVHGTVPMMPFAAMFVLASALFLARVYRWSPLGSD